MLNKLYTFPTKTTGPAHAMRDGFWYGDHRYTWDFELHFPVMTVEYAELRTGQNLSVAARSREKAEAELLTIAGLVKSYIFSNTPSVAHKHIEYRIAKDTDILESILLVQLEVLKTWGGYDSMYRVKDTESFASIGKAAIDMLKSTGLFSTYYTWRIEPEEYRRDY